MSSRSTTIAMRRYSTLRCTSLSPVCGCFRFFEISKLSFLLDFSYRDNRTQGYDVAVLPAASADGRGDRSRRDQHSRRIDLRAWLTYAIPKHICWQKKTTNKTNNIVIRKRLRRREKRDHAARDELRELDDVDAYINPFFLLALKITTNRVWFFYTFATMLEIEILHYLFFSNRDMFGSK